MINIFHISLFLFIFLSMSTILFVDIGETIKIRRKLKLQKNKFKIKYEKLLEETDTRQIYNYFLETRTRLSDNLHNIMLGNALGDDFYAKLYFKELDFELKGYNNCRCNVKKRVLG